jgi:hypothetical protein
MILGQLDDLEQHPIYGPRLAHKITDICGDSTARWQEFANSWAQPTQLLAATLFKRLERRRLTSRPRSSAE